MHLGRERMQYRDNKDERECRSGAATLQQNLQYQVNIYACPPLSLWMLDAFLLNEVGMLDI